MKRVHIRINGLVHSYHANGQHEQSREWLNRGIKMCQKEAPGGQVPEKQLERSRSVLFSGTAGPTNGASDANKTGGEKITAKTWKLCWNCGKQGTSPECGERGGPDSRLLRCSKCLTLKIATPAHYCSKDCQMRDWERHKLYHTKEKNRRLVPPSVEGSSDPGLSPRDEVVDLINDGLQKISDADRVEARRLFQKAIKLDPDHPLAHSNLGCLYFESGNFKGMTEEHTRELY